MIKFSYFNLILLIYIPQLMHNGQGKEKIMFGTKFFFTSKLGQINIF